MYDNKHGSFDHTFYTLLRRENLSLGQHLKRKDIHPHIHNIFLLIFLSFRARMLNQIFPFRQNSQLLDILFILTTFNQFGPHPLK